MRKPLARLAAAMLLMTLFVSGCTAPEQEPEVSEQTIYTSFFPLYALTVELVQGVPNTRLCNLVQPQDGCFRSYELSDWDAQLIASVDAMIIGGRGLESFEGTLTALAQRGEGPALISAMDGLTLLNQDQQQSDELESHLDGPNPWLFLSVDGASDIMESIAGGLAALDPSFEQLYAENLQKAQDALMELQLQMQQLLIETTPQPVALMHEGLPYFASGLGLSVAAQIDREPGGELYGADLDEAMALLGESGARVVLLEKQAPDALKNSLTQAGYQLALIDTLSTFPITIPQDQYRRAMFSNAQAVRDAFDRCEG